MREEVQQVKPAVVFLPEHDWEEEAIKAFHWNAFGLEQPIEYVFEAASNVLGIMETVDIEKLDEDEIRELIAKYDFGSNRDEQIRFLEEVPDAYSRVEYYYAEPLDGAIKSRLAAAIKAAIQDLHFEIFEVLKRYKKAQAQ